MLEAHPIDIEVLLIQARLLKETDRRDEALLRVERALRFAPRYCDALMERLALLVELKRPEDAREAFVTLGENCRDEETTDCASKLMESLG